MSQGVHTPRDAAPAVGLMIMGKPTSAATRSQSAAELISADLGVLRPAFLSACAQYSQRLASAYDVQYAQSTATRISGTISCTRLETARVYIAPHAWRACCGRERKTRQGCSGCRAAPRPRRQAAACARTGCTRLHPSRHPLPRDRPTERRAKDATCTADVSRHEAALMATGVPSVPSGWLESLAMDASIPSNVTPVALAASAMFFPAPSPSISANTAWW
jgi:hypothetical protein